MKAAKGISLAMLVVLCAMPVSAHRRDLMSPDRAGPIIRGETTMARMKDWFGRPDRRSSRMVGCIRVLVAQWDRGVTVYAAGDPRTVATTFVRTRSLRSEQHGELNIHTAHGLRVRDREGKLRRLYPAADPITHAGHTHYRLRTARSGEYLMAKVVGNRVVRFENWPYEFC